MLIHPARRCEVNCVIHAISEPGCHEWKYSGMVILSVLKKNIFLSISPHDRVGVMAYINIIHCAVSKSYVPSVFCKTPVQPAGNCGQGRTRPAGAELICPEIVCNLNGIAYGLRWKCRINYKSGAAVKSFKERKFSVRNYTAIFLILAALMVAGCSESTSAEQDSDGNRTALWGKARWGHSNWNE